MSVPLRGVPVLGHDEIAPTILWARAREIHEAAQREERYLSRYEENHDVRIDYSYQAGKYASISIRSVFQRPVTGAAGRYSRTRSRSERLQADLGHGSHTTVAAIDGRRLGSIGGPGSARVALFPSFQEWTRSIGGAEVDGWYSTLALVAFRAGGR
jgi:hypothetical protein